MKKSLGAKTLIYPTPVWVVGSYDNNNKPNLMTIAWGGICCSKPPCVTVALRKDTYTYNNIMGKNAFTVNVPSEQYVKEADYFGMASGKNVEKFSQTKLTAVKSELVDAPYVQEFPLILECKLFKTLELGLHTQFIGEIIDVKADETVLNEKGIPDLEKVKPFIYAPEMQSYFGIGKNLAQAFSIGKEIGK